MVVLMDVGRLANQEIQQADIRVARALGRRSLFLVNFLSCN